MILTQTYIESGFKALTAMGCVYLELGGMDRESCVRAMNERFEKEYPGMNLLNAKYSFRIGTYFGYVITLIGDLYK